MIRLDPKAVAAAQQGNKTALDGVVRAAERPIYNLALRMFGHPQDAEDAAQEILIKIITGLGSLRDAEAAGGWAMRIACRHLVETRRQSRIEAMRLSFRGFAADLEQGLTDPQGVDSGDMETALAIEEIKVGCTLAMLTCLSRKHRIAYLLGDVFELTDSEAAAALEIKPAAYRQRLRRARVAVKAFLASACGNVSAQAACRCERRVAAARAGGRLGQSRPLFGASAPPGRTVPALRAQIQRMEKGRRAAALLRSNPDFPANIADLALQTLEVNRRQ